MVFMVIAATAPLTAMASNFALSIVAGAGVGTLGWIVVVAVLLFLFAAGYLVLSRHVVNAGAYFAFLAFGLGRTVGGVTAIIAGIAYNLASAAMLAATGYFTVSALNPYLGDSIAWYWYTLLALVIVATVGTMGVTVASRMAIAVCIAQFVVVGAVIIAVMIKQIGNFNLAGLSPTAMGTGNFALTLVFCMLSFSSFEAAAIYGEECDAPTKKIMKATYLSLSILVVLFFIATWTLIAAFVNDAELSGADPGTLLAEVANSYLGDWAGTVISVCIALSFLAAAVAFHNMAARYHFSLSRARMLPAAFARVNARFGTPANATLLQGAISLAIIAPFAFAGLDPLLNLFPAVSGVTSLAAIYLMVGCCISVIVATVRKKVIGPVWSTLAAPGIAAVGLLIIGVVIAFNYQEVTGSESPLIAAMPLILIVGALYGAYSIRRTPNTDLANYLSE
jgi:amino acid transporter